MYSKYSNKYQQSLGGGGSYYSLYNNQEGQNTGRQPQHTTQYSQLPANRYNSSDDYIRGLDRLSSQLKLNNTLRRDR